MKEKRREWGLWMTTLLLYSINAHRQREVDEGIMKDLFSWGIMEERHRIFLWIFSRPYNKTVLLGEGLYVVLLCKQRTFLFHRNGSVREAKSHYEHSMVGKGSRRFVITSRQSTHYKLQMLSRATIDKNHVGRNSTVVETREKSEI